MANLFTRFKVEFIVYGALIALPQFAITNLFSTLSEIIGTELYPPGITERFNSEQLESLLHFSAVSFLVTNILLLRLSILAMARKSQFLAEQPYRAALSFLGFLFLYFIAFFWTDLDTKDPSESSELRLKFLFSSVSLFSVLLFNESVCRLIYSLSTNLVGAKPK